MQDTGGSRRWYDRMLAVDRRWIYVILAVAVVIPAIWSFGMPVTVSSEVRAIHAFLEDVQPGETVFLSIDFDPSTLAELEPMAAAALEQVWKRDGRVLMVALSQFGPAMAERIFQGVAEKMGRTYGEDFAFLGYKPYPGLVILAMGADFRIPFPVDYYNTPLDDIPMMADIRNYGSVKGVVSFAGGNVADMWITYGNARFGVPVALGVTGVMASDYYPYLMSGQIFGLIPGVKGAAEYEQLVGVEGMGGEAMPYQMTSHLVILLFMVITNIAFVAQRRARQRGAA